MKLTLSVLAVVAAVVATTVPTIPNFSENVLTKLQLTDPDVKESAAELINPEVKVHFKSVAISDVDAVTLFAKPETDEGKNEGICGSKIGIQITNGPTACNVKHFRLKLNKKNGITFGQVILFLVSEKTKPLLITTPLFSIPAEYASTDKEKTWANDNKVGLLSPINSDNLKSIQENESVTLDFEWFNALLPHGLTLRGSDALLDSYVSRPIAVTEADAAEFVKLIESKKAKEDSTEFLSTQADSLYDSAESEFDV